MEETRTMQRMGWRFWSVAVAARWLLVFLAGLGGLASDFGRAAEKSKAEKSGTAHEFRADVGVPMRDGVQLATHLFLPKAPGRHPAILMRTPYGKPDQSWDDAQEFLEAGYAVVLQDCRGRGKSQGKWDPFVNERPDGLDTQAWIGQQPWSDGQVGTIGGSYGGFTQWASAPGATPHLKAMVPIVPMANIYDELAYPGGAFQISLMFGWGAAVGGIGIEPDKLSASFSHLPLRDWDDQHGKDLFFINEWLAHPQPDEFWKLRGIDHQYGDVTVPVLNIGGWYDIFSKATIDLVDRVRSESKDRLARRNQFVIMGPWAHGVGAREVGQVNFGPDAGIDLDEVTFQWFDYWMKGKQTGVEDWPAYYLFVMGENRWRAEHEWPLKRTRFTEYYLASDGHAATRQGDGRLQLTTPTGEPADRFTYDPANPVPTVGGNNLVGTTIGPYDQSEVELRPDVLVFTSEAVTEPVEVTGPIKLVLYASSSAVDTDFTAKLVDVHPDGKAINLCDGILRARYRDSMTEPKPLEPGKVYRMEIDLWVTSNVFLPGHRLRLEVSSSNFPRFDRNLNTGRTGGGEVEMQRAEQTIYHDGEHPSHLLLPVIPR
jgi:hypothetical protein